MDSESQDAAKICQGKGSVVDHIVFVRIVPDAIYSIFSFKKLRLQERFISGCDPGEPLSVRVGRKKKTEQNDNNGLTHFMAESYICVACSAHLSPSGGRGLYSFDIKAIP